MDYEKISAYKISIQLEENIYKRIKNIIQRENITDVETYITNLIRKDFAERKI